MSTVGTALSLCRQDLKLARGRRDYEARASNKKHYVLAISEQRNIHGIGLCQHDCGVDPGCDKPEELENSTS